MVRVTSLLLVFYLIGFASCSTSEQSTEVRTEMQRAFSDTTILYTYAWDPEEFSSESNHSTISKALKNLSNNFHKFNRTAVSKYKEPGFWITLAVHQEMLEDIRKRFDEGSKDYANWKLRGLTANCMACHSRYQTGRDFLGDVPVPKVSAGYEGKIAHGEFLFASRRFSEAEKVFYGLAEQMSQSPSGEPKAIDALKLWLVAQVRVENRLGKSAKRLEEFKSAHRLNAEHNALLQNWIDDLQELSERAKARGPHLDFIIESEELLAGVVGETRLESDEQNLVKVLKASSLLHEGLENQVISSEVRRKALYLLALSYVHIPIQTFEIFPLLYLEQCIREFPGTGEAQKAFGLYESYIEMTGGSTELDDSEQEKLKELKQIAFKQKSLV